MKFYLFLFLVMFLKNSRAWKLTHNHVPMEHEGRIEPSIEPRKSFLPPIVPKWESFDVPIVPKKISVPPIDPFLKPFQERSIFPEKCGKRSVEPKESTKIINGHVALYGELPWQARFLYAENQQHFCGGTIISEFIIISAAHCFTAESADPTQVTLRIGDYKDGVLDNEENTFEIEKLMPHKKYDPKTMDNDIAIIKVKAKNGKGIVFGKYVQPACLVDQNEKLPIGKSCIVSGWGDLGGETFPNVLQTTNIQIMEQKYCKKPFSYGSEMTANMFCAGDQEGSTDSCQGDSGGPFICKHKGKFTLFGVVSWGNKCALPKFPGIYTKLSNYRRWIEKVSKEILH